MYNHLKKGCYQKYVRNPLQHIQNVFFKNRSSSFTCTKYGYAVHLLKDTKNEFKKLPKTYFKARIKNYQKYVKKCLKAVKVRIKK